MTGDPDGCVFTDDVRAFLTRHLHAVLATHTVDGRISQSVVWFALDGDTVWLSCSPRSLKVRHIRKRPDVSLLVLAPHGGSYVRIDGTASAERTVSDEARHQLVVPYQGAEADFWLAEHTLEEPNVRVTIVPCHVVSVGL
ncbi:MAG: pyridoxamine 5'-phosphate oxidase family protein [Acidimicrobiales bacterium]